MIFSSSYVKAHIFLLNGSSLCGQHVLTKRLVLCEGLKLRADKSRGPYQSSIHALGRGFDALREEDVTRQMNTLKTAIVLLRRQADLAMMVNIPDLGSERVHSA